MAEHMVIVDSTGTERGSVVVDSPETQAELENLLASRGMRLVEPDNDDGVELVGGVDGEVCEDEDTARQRGGITGCMISAAVSYAQYYTVAWGLTPLTPKLQRIVQNRKIDQNNPDAEAREAMAEFVEAVNGGTTLSPEQVRQAKAAVAYLYPDLAAQIRV